MTRTHSVGRLQPGMSKGTVAVLIAALLATSVSAAATPPAWIEQGHPSASGKSDVLQDVLAFSDADAWAVGRRYGPIGGSFEFRTLVQHWNGAAWDSSPSRDVESAPATNLLYGIGGTSTSDLWTVGFFRAPGQVSQTLIEHWNGSAWTIVASPSPGPNGSFLQQVAVTPTDAWAVGNSYDISSGMSALALRWNGAQWSTVPVPAIPTCVRDTELTDVAARNSNLVFVSGRCLAAESRHQGFVLRWNGVKWLIVVGPDTLVGDTQLNSVSFAGGREAWAVGDRTLPGSTSQPILLHWQAGAGWSPTTPPSDVGRFPSLFAVGAADSSRVWAVGTTDSANTGLLDRLTLRWDGGVWTRQPAGTAGRLFGVDVAPNGRAWAVGLYQQNQASLIITRRDPKPPGAP